MRPSMTRQRNCSGVRSCCSHCLALARSAVITPGSACSHLYDPPARRAIFYRGANAGQWGFVCSQPLFYYGKDPFLALR